ncbi:hypothetical protein BP6252_00001 [Coleophoma cylindrospora]|uniref:Zn(2)-C6 fungal-type domain-containing protein n=1 Tax=Coleophoma cylindrospora TaxID=1849047 RepID=A0A3D8SNQ9_9HELO|nr:hypothetical protein BP6252_00001 [Coleophoma cylindrospora]
MTSFSKSRNGCSECRAKRVKCDEGKPGCSRCHKKRIPCPGYKKDLRWLPWDSNPSHEPVQAEASPSVDHSKRPNLSDTEPLPMSSAYDGWISSHLVPISSPSSPSPSTTSKYEATDLINYYFSNICSLFSAFDGPKNPFRTTAYNICSKSALIHASLQSISAASLAKSNSVTQPDAKQFQKEAFRQLRIKLRESNMTIKTNQEEILLSLLLVGPTTSWHSPDDFGYPHYKMAVSLLTQKIDSAANSPSASLDNTNSFYSEALIYWWMLLCFISEEDLPMPPVCPHLGLDPNSPLSSLLRYPHPFTGVSPEVRTLFGRAGRLILAQRRRIHRTKFVSKAAIRAAVQEMETASELEQGLLSLVFPDPSQIASSGDSEATPNDFILVAESFKCAGLLLLYRTFPDLLGTRLQTVFTSVTMESNANTIYEKQRWLTSFAIHTLELLEATSSTGGIPSIQSLQPIILLPIACELRFPPRSHTVASKTDASSSGLSHYLNVLLELSPEGDEVANQDKDHEAVLSARKRIQKRITIVTNSLPAVTSQRLVSIIIETQKRMDNGDENVFWVDVMLERGWYAMFG